jgi:hypothetical protein
VAVVGGNELFAGGERRHRDLLRGDPVQLDEVVARALGDGEDVRGPAGGPGHHRLEDRALAAAHDRRVALEREVLDGEHRRARQRRRDRVDEVREQRTQAAEEPRHRPQHAELLHARVELDRADALRDEIRPARDGGDVEVAGKRTQQLTHIGLVARPVATEEVGVDDDHAAAASYAASSRRADSSHE